MCFTLYYKMLKSFYNGGQKMAKKKKGSLWKEFKSFISRGNVLDMAVGVVVGSAFTAIVNSLVKDILNPIIGIVTGGIDFSELKIVLKPATEEVAELAIRYGVFINAIIQFILIALVLFIIVKSFNKLNEKKKKEEEAKKAAAAAEAAKVPPAKPADIVLLEEIRDLLKK